MSDMIATLRSMAASEWANVYEHREFLLSVASLLTEYEADEPRKELVYVRREYDELKGQLLEARQNAAKAHETAGTIAARLAEAERQRDVLLDFAETVAAGDRSPCDCWVCELARQAKEAIRETRPADSAPAQENARE